MKVKVFDLPTYVNWCVENNGLEITKKILQNVTWVYEIHGKTPKETEKDNLFFLDEWCIEVDRPLAFKGHVLKVGDCFTNIYNSKLYCKIKSMHDDYFRIDIYNKKDNICVCKDEVKWYVEDIKEMYTPTETKEMTVAEIEKALGHKVKVVK